MPHNTKFEISVPLPLEGVIKRLEGARKEMAPKIGACTVAPDQSWFVCTVSYGSAYSVIRGQQPMGTSECKVLVETRAISVKPLIITAIGLVAIIILLDIFVLHPKAVWEWFSTPILIVAFVAISALFIPFSMQVLDRFIRETVLNDPEP